MTKEIYYNYFKASNMEAINLLSFLGFDGCYKKEDNIIYIYAQKNGKELQFREVGKISNRQLKEAIKNGLEFSTKFDINGFKSFSGFKPEENFSAQLIYNNKIKEIFGI